MLLFAQGEFARWFKSSSLQSSDRSSCFGLAIELGGDLSLVDSIVFSFLGCCGQSVLRTPNGNDYGKDILRQHYKQNAH